VKSVNKVVVYLAIIRIAYLYLIFNKTKQLIEVI